jgi:hypothetical protein
VDNDGNPLLTGALYFNTVANEMRVYSGAAWLASYLPAGAYATAGANSNITSLSGLTTALSPSQGGTGLTSPGSNGNLLTSNGTAWVSTAPAASGASKGQAIAFSLIFGL